ncbi:MAG: T9SS type A sorting domain-containing protein [Bacteroidota bacterium]|nr:T9SS type A sorting domain-containing protein [Bacteroidota bacterium]
MRAIIKIIFIILALNVYSKAGNENSPGFVTDILLIKDNNSISVDLIFEDAVNVGYNVNIVVPDSITTEMVNQHRLVILSTGNNPNPCLNSNMRNILISFADEGGKIISEGGQNAYAASVFPSYPAFKNKVLKVQSWTADNGGNLFISGSYSQSSLALVPTILPAIIQINFTNTYDQDVCLIGEFSDLFYKTSLYENNAGVVVSPNVLNPQLINYCFNYSSVSNRTDAKKLLTNSIYNLIGESVGVINTNENIPTGFMLYQNYPNPFNPNTVISYQLKVSSYTELKIYDVIGNLVEVIVNGKQIAGSYEVIWNGANFSSGIYFYTMSVNGTMLDSKKMFLIK